MTAMKAMYTALKLKTSHNLANIMRQETRINNQIKQKQTAFANLKKQNSVFGSMAKQTIGMGFNTGNSVFGMMQQMGATAYANQQAGAAATDPNMTEADRNALQQQQVTANNQLFAFNMQAQMQQQAQSLMNQIVDTVTNMTSQAIDAQQEVDLQKLQSEAESIALEKEMEQTMLAQCDANLESIKKREAQEIKTSTVQFGLSA